MSGRSTHRAVGSSPHRRTPRTWVELSTTRLLVAITILSSSLSVALGVLPSAADSYQIANDSSADSWYSNQPLLTPSAVAGGAFGDLFNTALSGKIMAQPLVDQGQVLVVTENDNAYGVSSSTGSPTWTMNYGPAATPAVDLRYGANACGDIGSSVGITGTPVIDPATNIAYFVAARATGPDRIYNSIDYGASTQYFLEAANVNTGAPPAGWPSNGVLISGHADNDSNTLFNADYQTQRPGLVLVNGAVYATFSSQCDFVPVSGTYTGWVVGISTTAHSVTTMWASEVGGNQGGGIWQSGGPPVVDSQGNIYVVSGNSFSPSVYPPAGSDGFNAIANHAEAVVKLSTSTGILTPVDWFVPANASSLDTYDLDLSSGGPVELPASMGTPQQPNVLLAVGKDATLYSLDMSNLGGYQRGTGGGDAVPSELAISGGVWGRPAVWPGDGGYIYLPTTNAAGGYSTGTFNAYQRVVESSGAVGFQLAGTSASFGYTSGSPVVTSNGVNSGSSLVWIIHSNDQNGGGGALEAFEPIPQNPGPNGTLTRVWSSAGFTASKFTSPGIGNGAVYVGTADGHLLGFGFTSSVPPITGNNVNFSPTTVSQSTVGTATFTATSTTTVTSFSSSGSAFTIGSPSPNLGASGATLQPGNSISVPVTFTPNSIGTNSGSLTVNVSTGSVMGAVTVTLSGTGLSATSAVVASPASLNFGDQPIAGHSVSTSVTMTNQSGSPITVTGFTSPLATTPFTVTGAPANQVLANGASVTFTVTFTPPGSSGNFSHSFSAVATLDTSVGNFGVPLSGVASPPALLAIVPTSLNFNSVQVGQSATLTFNVENNGGLPLTITSSSPPTLGVGISATTTLAANTIIAPNSSVPETVRFTPSGAGTFSDTWVVASNDGNPAATLVIRGTGVGTASGAPSSPPSTGAPSSPSGPVLLASSGPLSIVPTTLTFNSVQVGQSATLTFNVENNSVLPLTITSSSPPTLGVGFAATTTLAANTIIAANSSVLETVRFTPIAAGAFSDTWVLASKDGYPATSLAIRGTGVVNAPGAPVIGSVSAGNAQATVAWAPPSDEGGAPISKFTVTARDATRPVNGGQTCSASGSAAPACTVTGLTNGDSYTFSVTATNVAGQGTASGVSYVVTPRAPLLIILPSSGGTGTLVHLRTTGGASGATTRYFTIDGTAGGCHTKGDVLRSLTAGTCIVVAYRAAHGGSPAVVSAGVVIHMSGPPANRASISVTISVSARGSALSPTTKALLVALASTFAKPVSITIAGYALNDAALAKARAASVALYFSGSAKVKVSISSVTSSPLNIVTIEVA